MLPIKQFDVVIIGAGSAGLMCAMTAGARGRTVLVIDHADKPGKKILMSGGGRCNFTNLYTSPENFISHNQHFCKSALSRFTPKDFIQLVEKHQIPYHEKKLGQLFCVGKAKDIVNLLLTECATSHVQIKLSTTIESINKKNNSFCLITTIGEIACQSLVIATGGLSIPTMGASPFGYEVAKQFNIKVFPTRAGLVPFTLQPADKNRFEQLSGIAVDCEVTARHQSFQEAMLFTHRGLSGPAMLQISSYWQGGDMLTIKLLPGIDLLTHFDNTKKQQPKMVLKNYLQTLFAKKMVQVWFDETLLQQTIISLTPTQIATIIKQLQHWQIKPNATEGYRTAEVTLGGIDCHAISSKTFEALQMPGLYFIGEVLDVTGWLGGYNFQWAWASGFAAGNYV